MTLELSNINESSVPQASSLKHVPAEDPAPKPVLKVTWKNIQGASAEILSYEVTPNIVATLSFKDEDDPNLRERCGECLRRLPCFRNSEPDEIPLGQTSRSTSVSSKGSEQRVSRTVYTSTHMEGYLWKLNQSTPNETAQIAILRNWRRRYFFLQQSEYKLAMLYISEKDEGVMQMGCCLRDLSKHHPPTTFEHLQVLTLDSLSPADRQASRMNLHQYDVAFCKRYRITDEEYEVDLPTKMHPFRIKWFDSTGEAHGVTFATDSVTAFYQWRTIIIRELGPEAGPAFLPGIG